MSWFETSTSVAALGEGHYEATIDPRWWVVRGPHGGYLAAILLRALEDEVGDPSRPVRSFTTHFLRAPQEGTLVLKTAIERAGRSMTFASARAEQDGEVVAISLGAFSAPRAGFEFDDWSAPEVVPPEDAFAVPPEGDNVPPFLGNFDMRWAIGDPPFSGSDQALVGGWIRLRDPTVVDACAAAAMLDAWPPVIFPVAKELFVAPTVDLTMHFRVPLPVEGAGAEDFYLGRFSARLGRDGFFEEDGELWTADGRLVAHSRQLALAIRAQRPPAG